ncbi:uncharacterized protein J7T54_007347 [Emericellopsis cladophorae]|uniref:BZIP domain-containing protein n=1 Tax=Emericellopsis cladophorae TaxID=2686198 RepID=A0A9P9XZS5_9HYPO|nr:uncharacterized protein J7T54_007347 [Emericellopsis cladophorae]KAI6780867.1 hypothetical protein J7T54_007347 [Emericellopsis cladophorae]
MAAPNPNNVDIDALLDLTEYDRLPTNSSLSSSPASTSKNNFASPVSATVTTPSVPSTSTQTLSGPSHNYDMYRQQTGFVPGALANTMAVNQTNNTGYQDFGSLDYLSNMTPEDDIFDFNTAPSQGTMAGASDMDMEFDSPAETQNFFNTINPSSIEQELSPTSVATQSSNVGRLWPGAHSQAAMAKIQAQQRQQQQQQHQQQHMMQRQHQQQQQHMPQQPKARNKSSQPTDPLVEQKITQLLNSMRAKPPSAEDDKNFPMANLSRTKKEEDDMDEDERLLASEEGKKLSSKERRQLRNKVSARAFRSRRKEYITQLEAEIAGKVNENGDLRAQNRALVEENKRLTDLTRMLLASPSFSNFLDHLSANPAQAPAPQVKVEPQQEQQRQSLPKDTNPYGSVESQQQIGMAMIPEQTMDFSMLSLDNSYNFQPQVFVVDALEIPAPIDASALSGKSTNFAEPLTDLDEEKMEVPALERPAERPEPTEGKTAPRDEDFESDPEYALYHSEPTTATETRSELDTEGLSNVDLFGGIEAEKILARYELLDASEEETSAAISMARVQRISDSIESVVSRLELLTMDL